MSEALMQKHLGALRPADDTAKAELAKLKHGQTVRVEWKRLRNPRQHALYWALIGLVFEHQERYATRDQLHNAIKVAVGYCDEVEGRGGRTIAIPKSIAFGNMDQGAFEEFLNAVIRLVCTRILPNTDDADLRAELEAMVGQESAA